MHRTVNPTPVARDSQVQILPPGPLICYYVKEMDTDFVSEFVKKNKIDAEIVEHKGKDGTTSEAAAKAHGVDLESVVKTLLFINPKGEKLFVILQGNKKVDLKRIDGFSKAKLATPEQLKEILDAVPGGVPPIGVPAEISKLIDTGVMDQHLVIGSAGSPFSGIKLSPKVIADQENASVQDIAVSTTNSDERLDLITRNLEECLTPEDLQSLIDSGTLLNHYIGFEISGKLHIGSGLMSALKIKDLQEAGVNCSIFLADWHTWLNDKLGGDLNTIKNVAVNYFKEALRASLICVGADPEKLNFVLGTDLYHNNDEYWQTVIDVSKNLTLARVTKSSTIMGRKEGENQIFARLIYPPMQVADIFIQGINIAHSGMDQRKAHVIAREVAQKLKIKPLLNKNSEQIKPVAIHHHLILGLGKPPFWPIEDKSQLRETWSSMKMSKSKPDTCVFIHDSPDEIKRKINRAFCPEKEIEFNPVIDWAEHLVIPILGGLKIDRKEEFGGNLTIKEISGLEDQFASGQLHPMDLKNAVAEAIIHILEPARKHFEKPEIKKMLEDLEELI